MLPGRTLSRCTLRQIRQKTVAPDRGESDEMSAKDAAAATFRDAVSQKMVITMDASPSVPAPVTSRRWSTPVSPVLQANSDDSWADVDMLDKMRSDWELLDLPPFASRLTVELRIRILYLRFDERRYLKISDILSTRYRKKRESYRRAYRSVLARLRNEKRLRPFSAPSVASLEQSGGYGWLDFISTRAHRDMAGVLQDDSFKRKAKLYNFIRVRDAGKYYWKHDWYYRTKWERRWDMVKNFWALQVFVVQLPLRFGFYRGVLALLEHTSLLVDFIIANRCRKKNKVETKRVYTKLEQYLLDRNELVSTETGKHTIRVPVTTTGSAYPKLIALALLCFFAWTWSWAVYENQVPYFFLTDAEKRDRDQYGIRPWGKPWEKQKMAMPPPQPVPELFPKQ